MMRAKNNNKIEVKMFVSESIFFPGNNEGSESRYKDFIPAIALSLSNRSLKTTKRERCLAAS